MHETEILTPNGHIVHYLKLEGSIWRTECFQLKRNIFPDQVTKQLLLLS